MPKPNSSTLTYEQVSELLSYDPLTGDLYWKVPCGGRRMGVPAGSVDAYGYRAVAVLRTTYKSHRLAWLLSYGTWPEHELDHINGVRDDNRVSNLREASRSMNTQNLHRPRRDNKTGFLGVVWNGRINKFVAGIRVAGKSKHIGCFSDAETAHQAYVAAKRQLHEGNML